MYRPSYLLTLLALVISPSSQVNAQSDAISIDKRSRVQSDAGHFQLINQTEQWDPQSTALIICDMWDKHWCPSATNRVAEMATYMNEVVKMARSKGILIIHAPSAVTDFYTGQPARLRAMKAPKASNQPEEIGEWCTWLGDDEAEVYPIDQSDGGCECEDCPSFTAWSRQIETIEIENKDAISDNGYEIWNLLEAQRIKNVMLLGVHTNMCVLGRPFGLRNMARYGKNVVLIRDLTDTMYNPKSWPYVNHFTGTDLIIEHIEKYVCPTISSHSLTGKAPFRFKDDNRPKVAFIQAESEYKAEQTLPDLAHELQLRYDIAADFAIGSSQPKGSERNTIAGMESLLEADVAVVFARRRALPATQMAYLKVYLASGKPLVGIRTASHAFDVRGEQPKGLVQWKNFDAEVFGGNYHGHHGSDAPPSTIELIPGMGSHTIVKEFPATGFKSPSWLYKVSPLAATAQVLLSGKIEGRPAEPVLWTHQYGQSRIVYTSLGHWKDFENPAFRQLLIRSVFWAMGEELPKANEKALAQFEGKKK